jgi:hypothetical protein
VEVAVVRVLEEGKDNLFKLAFLRAGRRANIVEEETMNEWEDRGGG